jgi:hypothetical protein
LETIKIDLSDIAIVQELLDLIKRIYQHERTSNVTKSYIRFELGKFLRKDLDIKGFLEGKD